MEEWVWLLFSSFAVMVQLKHVENQLYILRFHRLHRLIPGHQRVVSLHRMKILKVIILNSIICFIWNITNLNPINNIRKQSVDIVKVIICPNVSTHVRFFLPSIRFFHSLSLCSSFNVWWKRWNLLSRLEKMSLCQLYSCDQFQSSTRRWFRWW